LPIKQSALQESLVTAYAAGQLAPAMAMLVETQAALRTDARDNLLIAETAAGAFFECEAPVDMSPDALSKALAAIDAAPFTAAPAVAQKRGARAAGAVLDEILNLPEPVRERALNAIGAGGWSFAGPGIRALDLDLPGDCKAELLRIEPGWGAPRHTHGGAEFTLVLTGAFHDERGIYCAGDIAVAGPGVTHRPTAERGEVCYSLAVTEAPLEFTGALGMIQKMLRH
jgi:putative transcriptional regulator